MGGVQEASGEGGQGGRKAKMIRGSFYWSKKCKFCGELITGESEQSRKKARVDFHYKLMDHGQDHHPELTEGGGTEMAKAGRHK